LFKLTQVKWSISLFLRKYVVANGFGSLGICSRSLAARRASIDRHPHRLVFLTLARSGSSGDPLYRSRRFDAPAVSARMGEMNDRGWPGWWMI
jgi:hypothetical protein